VVLTVAGWPGRPAGASTVGPTDRVLVIGDSLSDPTAPVLADLLRARGADVLTDVHSGTGLVTYRRWWLDRMATQVSTYRPTTVVVEFAGNSIPWGEGEEQVALTPDDPKFVAAWSAAANEAMGILTSGGARVVWALNPPMADPTLDGWADTIDLVTVGLSIGWPGIEFVDWDAALAGADGGFAANLDGETIRTADGVHLTDAGGRRAAAVTAAALTVPRARIAGIDRVATGVAVSARRDSAATVVLARADDAADALVAAPLAAALGAPLLLTGPDHLALPVAAEIRRLGAGTAVFVGGVSALSHEVATEVRAAGATTVERVAGPDRYATSALVAARVGGPAAFVASTPPLDTPRGWADAVIAAGGAAAIGAPLVLVSAAGVSDTVRQALTGRDRAIVVGGPASVPAGVVAVVTAIVPQVAVMAGADRYATARMVAEATVGPPGDDLWLAAGSGWADPAVAAATGSGPVLLVDGATLRRSPDPTAFLVAHRGSIGGLQIAGGLTVLCLRTEAEAATMVMRT
jgi:lysophospholipase L1-like esterase